MSFFDKLKQGLKKTKNAIFKPFADLLKSIKGVDEDLLEELEEILVCADVGTTTTEMILEQLRKEIDEYNIDNADDVREALKRIMYNIVGKGGEICFGDGITVVLVIGVNGVGKTTSIGKLARYFTDNKKSVTIAAADTFRAAAVDQLTVWSERAGVEIVKQAMGSDPASVAFDTLKSAVAKDVDVVLIDTAGRLHNRIDLMNELTKIRNVMKKVVPDAPHEVLLVLDGSTGQNAFQQAKEFSKATDITAMAITKLDGTAKGGVVVGVVDQFKVPVKFVGIGEGIDDLKVFNKKEFVGSLFSMDDIM